MASTILITCPKCKKQLSGPAELAGKRIRCKDCGGTFVVQPGRPAAKTQDTPKSSKSTIPPAKTKPVPKKPSKPEPVKSPEDSAGGEITYRFADEEAHRIPPPPTLPPGQLKTPPRPRHAEDEVARNPYGLSDVVLAPRCPQCAAEFEEEDQVICLNCGYNTQTRIRLSTVKTIEHTFLDWTLWLTPGILCVIVILCGIGTICYLWLVFEFKTEEKNRSSLEFPIQVWGSVIVAFICWICAKFAFKRLIKNRRPPEKIKR